jgi:KipI family sensor histidine kinase inhibitor
MGKRRFIGLIRNTRPCEHERMGLRALGDSAWLFEAGGSDPRARLELVLKLVRILERERLPEVRDVVSSFASVAVHFDPSDGEKVLAWLTALPPPRGDEAPITPRTVKVPVVYGDDLKKIATALGRGEQEIVDLHSAADYTVATVGFSPGFPYLLGLPDELRLPRLDAPRKVAAGSVAIAGNQAGIYPFESQGGWHVLGRTGMPLFDPFRPEAALFKPGDRVRFVPVERLELPAKSPARAVHGNGGMEVLEPGAFTTVQDPGRPGYQSLGVSPGGAADPVAASVVNRLVGNNDDAAVLECCMSGPLLRFHKPVRVAFSGWADAPSGRPIEMKPGGNLDLRGRMASARGYIAVSGGIDAPMVLGSRATDVRAGFGGWQGRALRPGDVLPIGPLGNGPKPGGWRVGWPLAEAPGRMIELRFLSGMQAAWFHQGTRELFQNSIYQLSPRSDRMGARLEGPGLERKETDEMVSQPVVAGSVQVPPDGKPIVLLTERQTIGGYPQIGHVISADLPKLARAWPGTQLRFREVTLDEARAAWSDLQRDFALLQAGLDFLR